MARLDVVFDGCDADGRFCLSDQQLYNGLLVTDGLLSNPFLSLGLQILLENGGQIQVHECGSRKRNAERSGDKLMVVPYVPLGNTAGRTEEKALIITQIA